ncbi:unnamed protein product [Amoebophrya sp. A120]|nr:unnamed protein product [Amoebophrya sp. A120]|eukprot:GSA120T00023359001.1
MPPCFQQSDFARMTGAELAAVLAGHGKSVANPRASKQTLIEKLVKIEEVTERGLMHDAMTRTGLMNLLEGMGNHSSSNQVFSRGMLATRVISTLNKRARQEEKKKLEKQKAIEKAKVKEQKEAAKAEAAAAKVAKAKEKAERKLAGSSSKAVLVVPVNTKMTAQQAGALPKIAGPAAKIVNPDDPMQQLRNQPAAPSQMNAGSSLSKADSKPSRAVQQPTVASRSATTSVSVLAPAVAASAKDSERTDPALRYPGLPKDCKDKFQINVYFREKWSKYPYVKDDSVKFVTEADTQLVRHIPELQYQTAFLPLEHEIKKVRKQLQGGTQEVHTEIMKRLHDVENLPEAEKKKSCEGSLVTSWEDFFYGGTSIFHLTANSFKVVWHNHGGILYCWYHHKAHQQFWSQFSMKERKQESDLVWQRWMELFEKELFVPMAQRLTTHVQKYLQKKQKLVATVDARKKQIEQQKMLLEEKRIMQEKMEQKKREEEKLLAARMLKKQEEELLSKKKQAEQLQLEAEREKNATTVEEQRGAETTGRMQATTGEGATANGGAAAELKSAAGKNKMKPTEEEVINLVSSDSSKSSSVAVVVEVVDKKVVEQQAVINESATEVLDDAKAVVVSGTVPAVSDGELVKGKRPASVGAVQEAEFVASGEQDSSLKKRKIEELEQL